MGTNKHSSGLIHPVILSGGVGSRLWPLSRALYPKQLLPLTSDVTMLQATARRVADPGRFAAPLVICNDAHRFIVAEQLREADIMPRVMVLEPEGRNTAPAVAVAALMLAQDDPDALLLILPSDHVIADQAGFLAAVDTAAVAAATTDVKNGALVTFGMRPHSPETGYGYIRQGDALAKAAGCFAVARFVEKPPAAAARAMLDEGGWFWNGGMFLFTAGAYLAELERFAPEVLTACRAALDGGRDDLDFFRLDRTAFATAPSISIDYAVMERTGRAAVVPADIGWNDIGAWSALWDLGDKDGDGNVILGQVAVEDVTDSYIRGDGHLVVCVGVTGLVIVATDDAVLVTARDKAQDVKKVVATLKANNSRHYESHTRVYRPWGYYQGIDAGDRFQVKQIMVKPGASLSLQKHNHRAEHWVVVSGTAQVTRGAETFELQANQSTYIPVGTLHRLENVTGEPLKIIEIQSGDYLGEDDIVRLEDNYGRIQ